MLIAVLLIATSIGCAGAQPLDTAKELAWKIDQETRRLDADERTRTTRPGEDASNTPEIRAFQDRRTAIFDMNRKLDQLIKDNKLNRADVNKVFEERKAEVKQADASALKRMEMEEEGRRLDARNKANTEPTPRKRIGE